METLKKISEKYLKTLNERSKKSRVYQQCQSTGLYLAEILEDLAHKSLYMKLAKQYDNAELMQLAKSLADRQNIKSKGAYFMKMLKASDIKKK